MTDKAELLALALRCEQATGPDRELERAIKAALEGRAYVSFEDDLANRNGATPPRYTASLDAAMTLVPGGHGWCVSVDGKVMGKTIPPQAHVSCEGSKFISAPTPALALCAAALKALASESSQ